MANTLKFGNGEWYGKKDTILAYNSENNNYKPLPFTFDRASSATRVNKDGLIETVGADQPRVDYLNDSKGALKLEPSRSNKITYSIPDSNWNIENGAIVTENYAISPDGSQNASRVQIPSGSLARIHKSFTVDSNEDSVSFYIKSNTGSNFNVAFYLRDAGFGTVRYQDTSLEITTEWQRVKIENQDLSAASVQVMVLFYNTAGSGNTWDFSLWGVQAEEGSYATSYIPTQGQSGGVTRVADSCNNGGNEQVINSTEGVLYAEMSALADDGTKRYISLSDGSNSNDVRLYFDTGGYISALTKVGGSTQAFLQTNAYTQTDFNKIAFKYKENDFSLYVNGVEVATDNLGSVNTANTLNELAFFGNLLPFYGNVKDVRVYNTALTDNELIALTTI